MEDVFKMMLETKRNWIRLDPWVPADAEAYAKIRTVSGKKIYEGYEFVVKHQKGGGAGMGEYPPTADIMILHTFED